MAHKKYAELIRAWLDGAVIEAHDPHTGWEITYNPAFDAGIQYRVKPVEPEVSYPSCEMNQDEVIAAWTPPYGWKGLRDFGDKVLRHACDTGQIVTREEFDRAVWDRAKRDMAIARAVSNAAAADYRYQSCGDIEQILAEIIKGVTR